MKGLNSVLDLSFLATVKIIKLLCMRTYKSYFLCLFSQISQLFQPSFLSSPLKNAFNPGSS